MDNQSQGDLCEYHYQLWNVQVIQIGLRDSELEKSLICILQDIGHEPEILDSKLLYNPEWPFILIPEFNFEFLGGDKTTKAYMEVQNHKLTLREIFWWSKWDSEVRVKAFDRLIGIYKAKS